VISRIPSSKRVRVDRWIASLTPLFDIINEKIQLLHLGSPDASVGPAFMRKELFDDGGDRIRKGAVWWVQGKNCGFHVDFFAGGIEIAAWTGRDRRTSTWISGKVTEPTLRRDLTVCFVAAGLTDLARTEQVRADLFSRTARS